MYLQQNCLQVQSLNMLFLLSNLNPVAFEILGTLQVGKLVVACRWSAVYSTQP